jgi:hypothetical protein
MANPIPIWRSPARSSAGVRNERVQAKWSLPPESVKLAVRYDMRLTGDGGRAPFEANMLELNRDHRSLDGGRDAVAANEPSAAESFTYALGIVRRQIFLVILFAMLGTGLGIVIFLKAAPTYTATATLLIDTHKIDILQQPAVSSEMPIGAMGAMESQIELLRSDEVALSVIKKLRLSEDPRFVGDGKPGIVRGLIDKYFPVFSLERSPPSDADRMEWALQIFKKNLTADQVGVAYAIEIDFESRYPDLAAQVANEVANAYNDLQRTSESDAARQASDWLETRMPDCGQRARPPRELWSNTRPSTTSSKRVVVNRSRPSV